MQQTEHLSLRISPEAKKMLADLANYLQRSQAGTVRFLVREKYEIVKTEKAVQFERQATSTK